MRKTFTLIALSAIACAAALYAAQDFSLSIRQVRDPVQLRDKLNANALDAETRIATVEAGETVTNAAAAFTTATNNIAALQAAASAGLYIVDTTQLVYIANSVTNLLDADITH